MDFKNKVTKLLEDALAQRNDLFLIQLEISDQLNISVVLDGDQGVNLQDCIDISRAIEHSLDKETYDFSLDVASAGVSSPLKFKRQYVKNIGRTLKVKTLSGTFEGVLTAADENEITLEWKSREPKPTGKGKHTVTNTLNISYDDIKEATVVLTF
ncbi:MAG: ribosome assembly cofactor RimP [Flavobacterium sp.]